MGDERWQQVATAREDVRGGEGGDAAGDGRGRVEARLGRLGSRDGDVQVDLLCPRFERSWPASSAVGEGARASSAVVGTCFWTKKGFPKTLPHPPKCLSREQKLRPARISANGWVGYDRTV